MEFNVKFKYKCGEYYNKKDPTKKITLLKRRLIPCESRGVYGKNYLIERDDRTRDYIKENDLPIEEYGIEEDNTNNCLTINSKYEIGQNINLYKRLSGTNIKVKIVDIQVKVTDIRLKNKSENFVFCDYLIDNPDTEQRLWMNLEDDLYEKEIITNKRKKSLKGFFKKFFK